MTREQRLLAFVVGLSASACATGHLATTENPRTVVDGLLRSLAQCDEPFANLDLDSNEWIIVHRNDRFCSEYIRRADQLTLGDVMAAVADPVDPSQLQRILMLDAAGEPLLIVPDAAGQWLSRKVSGRVVNFMIRSLPVRPVPVAYYCGPKGQLAGDISRAQEFIATTRDTMPFLFVGAPAGRVCDSAFGPARDFTPADLAAAKFVFVIPESVLAAESGMPTLCGDVRGPMTVLRGVPWKPWAKSRPDRPILWLRGLSPTAQTGGFVAVVRSDSGVTVTAPTRRLDPPGVLLVLPRLIGCKFTRFRAEWSDQVPHAVTEGLLSP